MLGINMGIEFCQTWPRVGCPGDPDNEGKCHKGNAGAVLGLWDGASGTKISKLMAASR